MSLHEAAILDRLERIEALLARLVGQPINQQRLDFNSLDKRMQDCLRIAKAKNALKPGVVDGL